MGACSSQYPFNRKKGQSNDRRGSKKDDKSRKSKRSHDSAVASESDLNGKALHDGSDGTGSSSFAIEKFGVERLLTNFDLYNILNDSGVRPYIHDPTNFLVIDGRDFESYSLSHVITAKQYAKFMNDSKNRDSLTKYAMIVIYGYEIGNNKPSKELLKLMYEIEEYVATDVLVLKDGFDSFQCKFSYLCTDRDIETVTERKLLLCYPSTIIDGLLYQGRGDQATNEKIVDTLGITHIVNISEHKNAFPNKIKYLKLQLEDMVTTNLSQHFEKTSSFIEDALSNNGHVLVHCNLGISRSSTITLAYLMKCKQWKLDHAFKILKARRTCSSPNSGFLRQLSEWEAGLFGQKCTDIESLVSLYNLNKR